MQLLTKSLYRSMAWRNGQGITAQIAIEPPLAKFPEDPFQWRLSSARVSGPNTFSRFPGYRRLLTVFEGNGLLLNHRALAQFEVIEFSGEEEIECRTLSGPGAVTDFGVIFDPAKISAKMSVVNVAQEKLELSAGTHFLFICEGTLADAGQHDTLKVQGPETLVLQNGGAKVIWIQLREITGA